MSFLLKQISGVVKRLAAAQGAIAYRGASEWDALAPGPSGQVLTSGGAAANPSWAAAGGLETKAGSVAAGSFTGNPLTVTVTFATTFADASYSVVITPVTQNGENFSPFVESQIAASFDINLDTGGSTDLIQVNWIAIKDGET